jgi:hypothetical protein
MSWRSFMQKGKKKISEISYLEKFQKRGKS